MQVEFFTSSIYENIKVLDLETRDHATHLIDILRDYGAGIRMPYSKPIGDGIFELRALGKTNLRFLYCFHKDSAIILHFVLKKQNKLNPKDILLAKRRKYSLA
jgi:phage-related protein